MNTPGRDTIRKSPVTWKTRLLVAFIVICLAVGGLAALLVSSIRSGGLRAVQKPPALEVRVAEALVNWSIPKKFVGLKNPVNGDPNSSDGLAGRELYRKHCEACHGFDGAGRTEAGMGTYPPPRDLSHEALAERHRTDGELFSSSAMV